MAKKNKNTSFWLKREINEKLSYALILFTILFCILVAFLYSIPSIGFPLESKVEFDIQNLQNQLSSWTSNTSKNHMTISNIKIPTFIYDLLGPTVVPNTLRPQQLSHHELHELPPGASQKDPLPNDDFDLLRVYQTGTPPGATAKNVKVITNSSTINKIYSNIKNLPIMLPGTYNCPAEFANSLTYSLNFYLNNTLTISALVQTSGCRVVTISPNHKPRMAVGPQGEKLFEDLSNL